MGARLLLLARRTRLLPELAIGLEFLLAGALGYGLLVAAESLRVVPAPFDRYASFAGVTALSLGALSLVVFTWRVFRPDGRGGQLAFVALALWLALGVVGSWVLHVERAADSLGGWLGRWAPNLGFVAAYAWAAFEPLRYNALLRRRAAMGIGDPLVANRMLLWGVGTLASGCVAALHLGAQLLGAYELPESLVGVVSLLVLVTAAAEWLAFFPPSGYLRRFETS